SKSVRASAANVNARRLRVTPVELVRTGPRGRQLWIAGLPVAPGRNLGATLDAAVTGDPAHTARTLASLDGAFAAFVWDPAERKLVVVTDFLGLQPLYLRRTAAGLALGSTIRDLADS
ncbi:MAG: hypothetical protein ACRD26_15330, partial [Vicinamibacterales bacterium]